MGKEREILKVVLFARLDSNRNFREGSKGKKKLLDLYSKNSNDKSEELQINWLKLAR